MSLVEQSKLSKEVMAFPGLVSLEKDPGDNGQVACSSAVVVREQAELPDTDFQTTSPVYRFCSPHLSYHSCGSKSLAHPDR